MTPAKRAKSKGPLRIIPLGGCGEMGLNATIIEYGDDILVVDCGQMFPEEDMPGVDLVIPDTTYLEENKDRIRGIVLTHAHDDHIGGLPYIIPKLHPAPIFGTALTVALLKAKLVEFDLDESSNINIIEQRDPLALGAFSVEWINVTHSIPDASALVIQTPLGMVVHSGDYKIDYSPIDGRAFDFFSLTRNGEKGILALLADSTNVERPGRTPSESTVLPALEHYFRTSCRSILLATFSTSLHRIQTAFNLAQCYGRKVFVSGLNMERNIQIASKMGYLSIPDGILQPIKKYNSVKPEKRLVLSTGSQGEPLSALSRMALDSHKQVKVEADDTVILSSRVIPGNERSIFRMVNHFFRRGANVTYEWLEQVHASGHAYSDDMRQLISLVRPRYLMPLHGEVRHRLAHKKLAIGIGMQPDDVFIPENGEVLEIFGTDKAQISGEKVPAGRVLVDGSEIGDVHEVVLRDRMHLAEDGIVLVLLTIDRNTTQLLTGPEVVSRGFVYMDESEELINKIKEVVLETFEQTEKESREEWAVVKVAVRQAVRRFLKKETQKFPLILPVITEI